MSIPLFVGYESSPSFGGQWRRGQRVELDGAVLPRHTFVCGSTGSGKTVFAKALLEEALLQGIPAIVIDVKGDLASLALLGAEAGAPWQQRVLGRRASDAASTYRDGAAEFPAVNQRLGDYADAIHPRLFTPASGLGRRLSLLTLPSFELDGASELEEESYRALNETCARALVSELFTARAVNTKRRSSEVRVVEELNWWASKRGESFEGPEGIRRLMNLVVEPPFTELGGMSYEEFLPAKQQQELRRRLASSITGAGAAKYRGEDASVETLLGGAPPGRVPLAIVSLAHINEFEQQALVVARIATSVYQWMRGKGGATRPRLLFFMDEVGGGDARTGFYPSAPYNPVSKSPLSLLVKQGRSAGVSMLLATQNPMSVDLRGLANVHTWAVGRLTQSNDQERVLKALSEHHTGTDSLRRYLPSLPTHTFIVKSEAGGTQEPKPVQERWLYSMHEPLSLDELGRLARELEERDWSEGSVSAFELEDGRSRDNGASPRPPAAPKAAAQRADDPREEPPTKTLPLPGGASSAGRGGRWRVTAGESTVPLALGKAVVVGRSRKSEFQVDDQFASGRHVRLTVAPDALLVEDLEARNKAVLNGEPLEGTVRARPDEAPHELVIGQTRLELSWG